MCGGCGRPLSASDPGATAYAGAGTVPGGGVGTASHDAPTFAGVGSGTAAPPLLGSPQFGAQPSAGKVAWPGVTRGRRKLGVSTDASAPWWRIPAIAGVVLVVLLVGTLGTWAFFVRPSMHTSLDTQMRSVLVSGVHQTFSGTIKSQDYTITAASLNTLVAAFLSKDSPVSKVLVSFANNQVSIAYAFWGGSGTVTSTLSLVNGHVLASGTSVDCPLCLIENGDEMEATFNNALAQIPSNITVTAIKTLNNALTVTVKV